MKMYVNKDFFWTHKKLMIKAAAIVLLIAVAFFVYLFRAGAEEGIVIEDSAIAQGLDQVGDSPASAAQMASDSAVTKPEPLKTIIVDVGGQVNAPKVVELEEDARVYEAVQLAGGLTAVADTERINMAAILQDGDKVLIPKIGETMPQSDASGIMARSGEESQNQQINLNTATTEQLESLSGVGPSTAAKIIAHREKIGGFKKIEDLMDVSGIGQKTFEKLKDSISV